MTEALARAGMTAVVADARGVMPGIRILRAEPILVPMRWGYLRRDGGRGRTTRWHLVPANALRDRTLCGVRPRRFAIVREWQPGSPTTRPAPCRRCRRAAVLLLRRQRAGEGLPPDPRLGEFSVSLRPLPLDTKEG